LEDQNAGMIDHKQLHINSYLIDDFFKDLYHRIIVQTNLNALISYGGKINGRREEN
jgi:hypothetical protein